MAPTDHATEIVPPAEEPEEMPLPSDANVIPGPEAAASKKNCTRRRNELIAKGAMNTGEYGLEYPKLAEVRPLIVGWSSVHRCPIGCVMLQSLPTHAGWLHAVTQFLRECASAQSH